MNPVLELEALAVGHGGVPIVRGIDLVVEPGEIVAILGANGAGKTTLLHTIAGVVPLIGGAIRFKGDELSGQLYQRARRGIALVTEERAVIRRLTVRENLRLGSGPADAALERFPQLRSCLQKKAGLLSGGEQQMLVLGRVLGGGAQLLLVDEMSFGLAPIIVQELLGALRDAADRGASVVLVEQHPSLALRVADHALVISGGHVAMSGTGAELLAQLDQIERAYLSVSELGEQDPIQQPSGS